MWIYTVVLQGYGDKDKRTMRFPLAVDHPLFADALIDAGAIKTALVAATKAYVVKETISKLIAEDGSKPTDDSADTYEEAAISAYLNLTTELEKLTVLAIPAPEMTMFNSDGQTLNTSDALVQAYIAEIENRVLVSDGERLQSDGRGDGAVKSGWLRAKARSFKPKV